MEKYYLVNGREVTEKEFTEYWKMEDFHYFYEGRRMSIPAPDRYGTWNGRCRYSIKSKL